MNNGFCHVPACQGNVLGEVVPELAKKEQSHVLMSTVPLSNRRTSSWIGRHLTAISFFFPT